MTVFGVDFAWGRPTVAQLKAAGVHFVCRYLSHDTAKDISLSELKSYEAAGIEVAFNWESTGTDSGRANGIADAHAAQALATALGKPHAPIIFSMDFDPRGREAEILAYAAGCASVLGYNRTGLYSGYAGIHAFFNTKVGKYGWQTYAWSGGQWDPRAQLQQYSNGHTIGGKSVDFDRATTADFGQCNGPSTTPPPPPATLKLGDKGPAVAHYQTCLNTWGAKPLLTVDGDFGPLTETAVKAFQLAHNLTVNGEIDTETAAALNQSPHPVQPPTWTPISQGSTDVAEVKHVQTRLNVWGQHPVLVVDGDFGVLTEAAVREFQLMHGLTVDGIVGPQTISALNVNP